MFEFFKDLIFFGQKACSHTKNYKTIRYFEKDGAPMLYFRCLDCGFEDHGVVIGPGRGEKGSEDWEGVTTASEGRVHRPTP